MLFLAGYTYRKKITITGEGGAGTDYQMLLKVGAATEATGDDFHLEEHCENFPTDIRFTDDDGETELDFYHEKTVGAGTSAVAWLWVKVDDDLDGNQDVYIYYGKSGDSTGSNGDNTFLLFEDFEDLNTGQALAGQGGWIDGGGTAANLTVEANQKVEGNNSAENTKNGSATVYRTFTPSANVRLVFNIRVSSDGAVRHPVVRLMDSDNNRKAQFIVNGTASDFEYYNGSSWQDIHPNYTDNTWYRIEGEFAASDNKGRWRYDKQAFGARDTQYAAWTVVERLNILTDNTENQYFDQIFVAKAVGLGTEPAFNAAGGEEYSSPLPAFRRS